MVEMCKIVGSRDQLITLLLQLTEHVLNIILIHLQDRYAALFSTIDILVFCLSWKYFSFLETISPGSR